MASVARVLFLSVLAILVPTVAWLVDPGLDALAHVYVVGALVTVFVATDYVFGQLIASFSGLSRSSVLTLAESRRLENQLRARRNRFKLVWGMGIALRIAHSLLVALALGSQPDAPQYLASVLLAYAVAGVSLGLAMYFFVAYNQAESFLEVFAERERNERERESMLRAGTTRADVL